MYVECNNILVHRVQGCMRSTDTVHGVQDYISLYVEYKLFMSCDTESLRPDDDLYDVTESLQPYISISNPISIYIVLVQLIIVRGWKTCTPQQWVTCCTKIQHIFMFVDRV